MTIRNLDAMFHPRSVAVIGASNTPGSVGEVVARNMYRAGFGGVVMPVNPKHHAISGVLAYRDVAALPEAPDLAVIATPPDTVPGIIAELGARGTRAAVILTAGFGEGGGEAGASRRQAVLDAAKPHLMRIVGPNCLGVIVPRSGLNASFSHLMPAKPEDGGLAFVTQSGAVVTSVIDWAAPRGIGFSHLVSLGDMIDVDFGDMLDYLANDPKTRAILLYVEAVTGARKFMSAARAAARSKPVIVVKAGRHVEGARAASSHTGALAGEDAVYEAVFRRAGLLRVLSLEDLFHAAEMLSTRRAPRGDRVTILSNGGGIAVLATDALIDEGGRLAEIGAETKKRLDAVLPPTWSHANPVDIIGDADGARYAAALEALMDSPDNDAVLVLNCPAGVASSIDAARAVVHAVKGRKGGPVTLTSWVGEATARDARALFAAEDIATYETPEEAIHAFMYLVNYRRSQDALLETPPSIPEAFTPDADRVAEVIRAAVADGREWLSEPEAKAVLEAYGVPVTPTRTARDAEAAAACATEIGVPVALKILSPDITHKSDVGGVALDLESPDAVKAAAETMLRRVGESKPDARIDGFTVQAMAARHGAHELLIGVKEDAQFGPVIMFGHGGTAVEVVADRAIGLPPLNMKLARGLMERTRVFRLLSGFRDQPAADLDGVAMTLIKVAQLAADHAEIIELDINPLLADAAGVVALDARIRVAERAVSAIERLAIRPYPKELEETITLSEGRTLLIRPVAPEDEPSFQAAFSKLSPEAVRQRFRIPLKTLGHVAAARFTQIDYDREMALVLTEPGAHGRTEIFGVVRIGADPDMERAEYAIIVRDDMTGKGLGRRLMERIIAYAKSRGITRIAGDVLRDNAAMLAICDGLGFTREAISDEPEIVRVSLAIT